MALQYRGLRLSTAAAVTAFVVFIAADFYFTFASEQQALQSHSFVLHRWL